MLVIAHRGASAERPENTVAAFAHAAALGADWVELDVWATAEGILAVVHDPPGPGPLPAEVPDLATALDACGAMGVNVEIKGAPVDAVARVVRAWGGEVLVSSFDPGVVDEARAAGLPTAQLTWLPDRPVGELVAEVAARGHRGWHPHHNLVDADSVAATHDAGLRLNTWTVDDPARVAELAALGVDGVVTNDVSSTLRALDR